MPSPSSGIVVFGDVIDSRRSSVRSTAFLRALASELERAYAREQRLAPPGITQGDELQLLLAPDADPFPAVVRASLRPDTLPMRWAIVTGLVDPGRGRATERTGPAFVEARRAIERSKPSRELLTVRTGDPARDALLNDLAPLLPRLLGELTARQRELARLLLVDGLRQADAADVLGISRATVSVMTERARIREIGRLAHALAALLGVADATSHPVAQPAPASPGAPVTAGGVA